jgi:hypothetical protein
VINLVRDVRSRAVTARSPASAPKKPAANSIDCQVFGQARLLEPDWASGLLIQAGCLPLIDMPIQPPLFGVKDD